MKKIFSALTIFILSAVYPFNASAEETEIPIIVDGSTIGYYCIGNIDDWEVAKWGTLYIDGTWNGSGNSQTLCALDGSWKDVTTEACKAWMLTVQEAAKTSTKVKLKYEGVAGCKEADLGKYSTTIAPPQYIKVYGK